MIQLGKTYQDRISELTGVAVGHVHYITGCNQVLLQPRSQNGRDAPESHWVDEQRLIADENWPDIQLDNGASPGFDRAPPKGSRARS